MNNLYFLTFYKDTITILGNQIYFKKKPESFLFDPGSY